MLNVSNLSVQFGKKVLFDNVNISFTKGNCYGIIGANGAGKSTFLKILSKVIEPNTGVVHLEPEKRMSVLEQNHFAFDDKQILETVLRGNKLLFSVKKEMDEIYSKSDFSDSDSDRVGVLQLKYEEMDNLLREMEKTPNSDQCNHGRPTYLKLDLEKINKLFGRT